MNNQVISSADHNIPVKVKTVSDQGELFSIELLIGNKVFEFTADKLTRQWEPIAGVWPDHARQRYEIVAVLNFYANF